MTASMPKWQRDMLQAINEQNPIKLFGLIEKLTRTSLPKLEDEMAEEIVAHAKDIARDTQEKSYSPIETIHAVVVFLQGKGAPLPYPT